MTALFGFGSVIMRAPRARGAGGRLVVSRIEAGAFEDDADGGIDFPEALFATFRAAGQRLV